MEVYEFAGVMKGSDSIAMISVFYFSLVQLLKGETCLKCLG